MKLRGYQLVILSCLVIGLTNLTQKRYVFGFSILQARISIIIFLGLMFLVYPLLGHLADVYLNRYRMLKSSYVIIIIGGSAFLAYMTIDLTASWSGISHSFITNKHQQYHYCCLQCIWLDWVCSKLMPFNLGWINY